MSCAPATPAHCTSAMYPIPFCFAASLSAGKLAARAAIGGKGKSRLFWCRSRRSSWLLFAFSRSFSSLFVLPISLLCSSLLCPISYISSSPTPTPSRTRTVFVYCVNLFRVAFICSERRYISETTRVSVPVSLMLPFSLLTARLYECYRRCNRDGSNALLAVPSRRRRRLRKPTQRKAIQCLEDCLLRSCLCEG